MTRMDFIGLLSPHMGNPVLKAKLASYLRSKGYQSLPEAHPSKGLYDGFSKIIGVL